MTHRLAWQAGAALAALALSAPALLAQPAPAEPALSLPPLPVPPGPQWQAPEIRDSITAPASPAAPTAPPQDEAERQAHLIEQAMLARDWARVVALLPAYAALPGHDPILLLHARGAAHRHMGRHRQAIADYRAILAAQPQLLFVRLDLAIMLAENRESPAAQDQLRKVLSAPLPAPARQLAGQYLDSVQRQTGWNYDFSLQYTRNDNVNNASYVRELQLFGLTFLKNADALPRKATGVSYSGQVRKEFSLEGNHYLSTRASLQGVNYGGGFSAYDEQAARLGLSYRHQTLSTWWDIGPTLTEQRLGRQHYGRSQGFDIEHGRWLTSRWLLVGSGGIARMQHADRYRDYDGHSHKLAGQVVHVFSPTLSVNAGLEWQRDHLRVPGESSTRRAVSLGVSHEWAGGLSTRLQVRHGRRGFDAPFYVTRSLRVDDETSAVLSVWHRQLQFMGVTPRINLQRRSVDSSIPAFFSRRSQQMYLTFDRTF